MVLSRSMIRLLKNYCATELQPWYLNRQFINKHVTKYSCLLFTGCCFPSLRVMQHIGHENKREAFSKKDGRFIIWGKMLIRVTFWYGHFHHRNPLGKLFRSIRACPCSKGLSTQVLPVLQLLTGWRQVRVAIRYVLIQYTVKTHEITTSDSHSLLLPKTWSGTLMTSLRQAVTLISSSGRIHSPCLFCKHFDWSFSALALPDAVKHPRWKFLCK